MKSMETAKIEILPIESIELNTGQIEGVPENPRTYSNKQMEAMIKSIKDLPDMLNARPLIVYKEQESEKYIVIGGNRRFDAAKHLKYKELPCYVLDKNTSPETIRSYLIKDNLAFGDWDISKLIDDWEAPELEDFGFDTSQLKGFGDDKLKSEAEEARKNLSERYLVPPFSVLHTYKDGWANRKQQWIALGIKSEEGRKNTFESMGKLTQIGKNASKELKPWSITSIFDPVLTELIISWFSGIGDKVLDPFAGGSVRGIVSSLLGREYTGIDLRQEQIDANNENWEEIGNKCIIGQETEAKKPKWVVGDSDEELDKLPNESFDLAMTCPPYADLEVYSDDPRDISNMEYDKFIETYGSIIKKTYKKLTENSFCVFVVGEVRGRDGSYYNFVGDTVKAFENAGFKYYNEIVLATSLGTAALRTKQFNVSRKATKVHQNVLVFSKGEPTIAAERLEEIERQFSISRKCEDIHQKVLVFLKGDGKKAAERCGEVEVLPICNENV